MPRRGTRRRHRGGQHPAVRRPDGVRRPARRLHRGPRRLARQLPGRLVGVSLDAAGQPGLPACAAGQGAAHPPGKGDEQHLHRAGAARGHRRDVRGLPRPGRAGGHRQRRAPQGRRAGGLAPRGGLRRRARELLRHGRRDRHPRRRRGGYRTGPPPGYNLYLAGPDTVQAACDETTTGRAPAGRGGRPGRCGSGRCDPGRGGHWAGWWGETWHALPAGLRRTTGFLTHPVFHEHHSETSMLRYLRRLADFDLALDRSMIPLGSCTMKLNAAAEMEPITWPQFAGPAPLRPGGPGSGLCQADRRPRLVAGRDHRVRGGVATAERRLAGGTGRPAGHPRLPHRPRRAGPGHLPDP